MMEEPAQAFGGASASSANPILEAIEALSAKMNKMALKSDLEQMESNMKAATKISIAEAIDPVKSKVYDIKGRVTELEKPGVKSATTTTPGQAKFNELKSTFDPAKCCAALLDAFRSL